MKVLSFSLASPASKFKVVIQFRRTVGQFLLRRKPVVSTFTDHFTFWSELPPSGVQVTCDPETAKFLDLLRSELEKGIKSLPKDQKKAFQKLPVNSFSR